MAAVAEGGIMPQNSLRIFLSQEVRWGSNSGGIPPSHLPLSVVSLGRRPAFHSACFAIFLKAIENKKSQESSNTRMSYTD